MEKDLTENAVEYLAAGASRKFYEISEFQAIEVPKPTNQTHFVSGKGFNETLLTFIRNNVMGNDKTFSGPFGLRKAVYCDYTASGRSLKCIEDYISSEVLPEYGNTHTTTTVTSLQTTLFRHEARDIVRNAVNASEHDAVIFAGSGCTGAVHKLIHALHLQQPPVVFVGPYEHHSNLLPWREIASTIIRIQETPEGLVNLDQLKEELKVWTESGRQLIGCFAAASNVTGTLVDVNSITVCLHKHGALALWDYATAGPYMQIDMNPVIASADQPYVYKDAVFIATHKFVGGVQTPGILVAKKALFRNPVPSGCGGGSVFFVRRDSHRYLQEAEMREEGGTPAIVESIRAGLVFQLKEAVSPQLIMEREHQLTKRALDKWRDIPNLILLGNQDVPHLPIYSFLIKHPETGLFLHHNFVCALLNDLFGIQARGGCACAGPYAEDLLGINEDLAMKIEDLLVEDSRLDRTHLRRYHEYSEKEILRPGFARLNLPYFMDDETIDFVLEAVKIVAEEGWKLLSLYKFNPETGEWKHHHHQLFKDRKWLGHISYKDGTMKFSEPVGVVKGPLPENNSECLNMAREFLTKAQKVNVHIADQTSMFEDKSKLLRWFLLPSEASLWLKKPQLAKSKEINPAPFHPISYPRSIDHKATEVTPPVLDTGTTQACGVINRLIAARETFKTQLEDNISKGFEDSGDKLPMQEVTMELTPTEAVNRPTIIEESSDTKDKSSNKVSSLDHCASASKDSLQEPCLTEKTEEKLEILVSEDDNRPTTTSQEEACNRKRKAVNKPTCQPKKTAKEGQKWHAPPKSIFKPTLEALQDYSMIKDKDKVLVCLSGGKDSLTLLHTLKQYQFYAKKKGVEFSLGAVTVDPQTSSYDPSPLKSYLQQLGVPYFYEEQCIMDQAQNLPYECASICSFCSRMKRGRLYAAARREGYNVLALGQHLDDIAESFLMSVFHNGMLRTMKAHYTVKEEDLRVIRPLIFVREKETRQFAEQNKLPIIAENCPACFEAPKERHRMKQMLASQEILHPRLFHSLLSAIKPIIGINKTGVNVKGLIASLVGQGDEEEKDIDD